MHCLQDDAISQQKQKSKHQIEIVLMYDQNTASSPMHDSFVTFFFYLGFDLDFSIFSLSHAS
jgi:hypothetical protein